MKFDGYQTDRFFDEMFAKPGVPRPGAKLLVERLESLDAGELIERQSAAELALLRLKFALKVGVLAFDSTRISAADVDFPIDVAIYVGNEFRILEHRYEKSDLSELSTWWDDRLRKAVNDVPADALDSAFR